MHHLLMVYQNAAEAAAPGVQNMLGASFVVQINTKILSIVSLLYKFQFVIDNMFFFIYNTRVC